MSSTNHFGSGEDDDMEAKTEADRSEDYDSEDIRCKTEGAKRKSQGKRCFARKQVTTIFRTTYQLEA